MPCSTCRERERPISMHDIVCTVDIVHSLGGW